MKCKNCKQIFNPVKENQKYCFERECLNVWIKTEKEKQWKERKKQMKEDLKSVTDYTREAQKLVNKYVRLRDIDNGCISCEADLIHKHDAGHYFSAFGYPSVRFDEDNVNSQCVYCNKHNHGSLIEYQKGLIKKIGQERFNQLELKASKHKTWTKSELKEIIKEYKEKIKNFQNKC